MTDPRVFIEAGVARPPIGVPLSSGNTVGVERWKASLVH